MAAKEKRKRPTGGQLESKIQVAGGDRVLNYVDGLVCVVSI